MRFLISLLLFLPLAAQEQTTKAPEGAAAEKKGAESEPAAKADAEKWLSGSVDLGYRWVQMNGGNFDVYRSIVNLGEGPKVLGADFTITDPQKRSFDQLRFSMHQWGGEPYSTMRGSVAKERLYRFSADYRSLAYFNNIPTFANPLLARGVTFSQNGYDSRRRFAEFELELFPSRKIVPYFAYSRDWGKGQGVLPYVTTANEYAVPVRLNDRTHDYRGGVRIELDRYHVTLEEGGTQFLDTQEAAYVAQNLGNLQTPLLGQVQSLTKLSQVYDVTGSSTYTKVVATAAPFRWLNAFGQFLYSKPDSKVTYRDSAAGAFFQINALRLLSGQQDLVYSFAKQPHPSGMAGLELRPFRRVRIVESIMTDRLHNATSALLTEFLLLPASTTPDEVRSFTPDRLVYNYNRQELNAFVDVTSKLTLRGGFRYVWGDAQFRAAEFNPFRREDYGELNQKVGIAGINFRWNQKFSFNGEFEGASSDKTYFRTSLQDYRRMRLRGRYQVKPSLLLSATMALLDNQNPSPGLNFDFRQRSDSVSVQWTPQGAKRFSLLGDYTRSTLRSDLLYLNPAFLGTERSFYHENAHLATGLMEASLFKTGSRMTKVSAGGSLFVSSFSRATNYYQPFGRLTMPVNARLEWFGEWRWFGYSETSYAFESFRTNHFILGFRFTI